MMVKLKRVRNRAQRACHRESFCFFREVDEVTVVSPDFKDVRVAFEVVTKNFQGPDDSKEFFIMNFVVAFCWL